MICGESMIDGESGSICGGSMMVSLDLLTIVQAGIAWCRAAGPGSPARVLAGLAGSSITTQRLLERGGMADAARPFGAIDRDRGGISIVLASVRLARKSLKQIWTTKFDRRRNGWCLDAIILSHAQDILQRHKGFILVLIQSHRVHTSTDTYSHTHLTATLVCTHLAVIRLIDAQA